MPQSIVVTEFDQFYLSKGAEELRYYPSNQRAAASAHCVGPEVPPLVQGFGVFDTTVSTDYAVAVYGDLEAAEAHKASAAPKAPSALSKEASTHASDCGAEEAQEPFETKADQERVKSVASPLKKRSNKRAR